MGLPSPAAFYALSPDEQVVATARWTEEQRRCPKCGNPRDLCSDPEQVWFPQRAVCFASMELAAAEASCAAQHSEKSGRSHHDGTFTRWSGKWSTETPYAASDGVTVYVTPVDIDPGDNFTTQYDAQPAALRTETVAAQSDSEPDGD